MNSRKTLVVKLEAEGRIGFWLEESSTTDGPNRVKFFELEIFDKHSRLRPDIEKLIGNFVLGGLDIWAHSDQSANDEARRKRLALLAKLEKEAQVGQVNTESLSIRAELEFVESMSSRDVSRFLKAEALYKELAAAGSRYHIEKMKNWPSLRDQYMRILAGGSR